MADERLHRLRLKLSNGAELEAEGTPDFVAGERREFLELHAPTQKVLTRDEAGARPLEPAWEDVVEARGSNIQLRAKLLGDKGEKEACLILIAASQRMLRNAKPTAAQLARWLRASGYPVRRVDRAIAQAIESGEILASGARRARRYSLSAPGLAKAFNLDHQLGAMIRPAPEPKS